MKKQPKICILMGTYNGERFLQEQLDSFCVQTYTYWTLHISDDGSTDNTLSLLKKFQEKIGADRVFIYRGPQKGFAANFLSLVRREEIQGDYYAFSDQDDVWEPNKLARALSCIEQFDQPALYGARTILTDENNEPIGFSTLWKRKPSFKNALVQSIASGNTMLFNNAARELLKKDVQIFSHDWWAYQVISGCGGVVWYDSVSMVRYRQHGKNLLGRNDTLLAKWWRIKKLFSGDFKRWNEENVVALLQSYDELTNENKKVFDGFCEMRKTHFINRMLLFCKVGAWRQTILGQIGLLSAIFFKKL